MSPPHQTTERRAEIHGGVGLLLGRESASVVATYLANDPATSGPASWIDLMDAASIHSL